MEGHTIFQRTDLLIQNLIEISDHPLYDDSSRITATADFCILALEHAESVRNLAEKELYASCIALMRVQFETLVRGIWALYCASDEQIQKITAGLNAIAQQQPEKIPMAHDMLLALCEKPQAAVPFNALSEFKEYSWKPLNSFVHAGIHPLARQRGGYPIQFIEQLIKISNGLVVITFMQMCVLTGNGDLQKQISPLHTRFADCLPDHRNSV